MKFRFPKLERLDTVVVIAIVGASILAIVIFYWLVSSSRIVITNNDRDVPEQVSALRGEACQTPTQRPIAVMLASDYEARPLSAVGQADMVFEMPVTPDGITRMMAVYQCSAPKEMGSIRSARADFIPLAQGLDAILVHWGGEKDALDSLNRGVINNIDALKYEGTTFYRKNSIPRPHNGFTSSELLTRRIEQLDYRATTSLDPYLHLTEPSDRNLGSLVDTIEIPWPQGMSVRFTYDRSTNTYVRARGGSPEYDAQTNTQVRASVVILVETTATFQHDQYIRVDTLGSGAATIWQNGRRMNGLWRKDRALDKLVFTDSQGTELPLMPGMIWVLIDAPLSNI